MKYIYIILGVVIIILLSFDIWQRHSYIPPVSNDQTYRDSIKVYQNQIVKLDSANQAIIGINIELNALKRKTKYIYREKIVFINGLTTSELDSTIRSSF